MFGDKIYLKKKKEKLLWCNHVCGDTRKDLVEFLSVFTDSAVEENCIKKARRKGIWAVYSPTDRTS